MADEHPDEAPPGSPVDGDGDDRPAGLRGRVAGVRAGAAARWERIRPRWWPFQLAEEFVRRYIRLSCGTLAGDLAFRAFVWLLPFVFIAVALISLVGEGNTERTKELLNSSGIAGSVGQNIADQIHQVHKSWWIVAIIGLFGLVSSGLSLVQSLRRAHFVVWGLPPEPTRSKAKHLLGFIGTLIAAFAIANVVSRLAQAGPIVAAPLSLGLFVGYIGLWFLASWAFPHRDVPLTSLLPGAVLFGIAFEILHAISAFYLPHRISTATQIYGVLGISFVVLAWLLIIGHVTVSAALLNAVWADHFHPVEPAAEEPATDEPGPRRT